MVIESQLEKSAEWMKGYSSLVDGVNFETTNRLRVSMSLFHLCVEHQNGIHVLVEHRVNGSAFALFRPQFEAYLRGVWFHRCATDVQLLDFLNSKEPPKYKVLMTDVQKLEGYEEGALGRFEKEIMRNLHDFTHGGVIQVKARITKDEICSDYRPEHIANLLQSAVILALLAGLSIASAVILALLAGLSIASAVNDNKLSNSLSSLYQHLYKE